MAARSAELADWLGIAARRCGADAAMAAFLRRPGGQEPAPGAPEAAAGAGAACFLLLLRGYLVLQLMQLMPPLALAWISRVGPLTFRLQALQHVDWQK